jgi:prolyl oligopeptidase
VRRPDLWAAIIINVGEPNTIRKEHDTQAAIPEIGSTATEEGFAALRITDSYSRVEDDVAYPAVLLTTGGQDPIVPTWQLAKMAARLQAATASHNRILLSFMVEMGHIPGTEQQWADVHADTFVFILAAMKR